MSAKTQHSNEHLLSTGIIQRSARPSAGALLRSSSDNDRQLGFWPDGNINSDCTSDIRSASLHVQISVDPVSAGDGNTSEAELATRPGKDAGAATAGSIRHVSSAGETERSPRAGRFVERQRQIAKAKRQGAAKVEQAKYIRYLNVRQVASRYGVSVTTIWRWVKSLPGFPLPHRISRGTTRWDENELEDFDARGHTSSAS